MSWMVPESEVQQLDLQHALESCGGIKAVLATEHSHRVARHLMAEVPLQDSIERLSQQGSAQGTPVRQHAVDAAQPAQRPVSSQRGRYARPLELQEQCRPDSAASGYEAALSSGGVTPASNQGMPGVPEQAQQASRAPHSSSPASPAEYGSRADLQLQLGNAQASVCLAHEDSSPDLTTLDEHCPQCCHTKAQMKRLQTQVRATIYVPTYIKVPVSLILLDA